MSVSSEEGRMTTDEKSLASQFGCMAVCDTCADIYDWDTPIEAALKTEFQDVDYNQVSLPSNHPYWMRRDELWSQHKRMCAVFSYDDWSVGLCPQHLRELADGIERA